MNDNDTTALIRRARELASLAEGATHGPWRAVPVERTTDDGQPYIDGYAVEMPVYSGGVYERFAYVGGYDFGKPEAELISATPDMAELLKKMADELEKLKAELEKERWL